MNVSLLKMCVTTQCYNVTHWADWNFIESFRLALPYYLLTYVAPLPGFVKEKATADTVVVAVVVVVVVVVDCHVENVSSAAAEQSFTKKFDKKCRFEFDQHLH